LKKLLAVAGLLVVSTASFALQEHQNHYKSHEERHAFEKRVEFSVDYWLPIPDGWFKEGDYKYRLRDDLKLGRAKDLGGKIIYDGIEWGFINIVFTYTPIKFDGSSTTSSPISIGGFSINTGEKFEAIYDFNNYDLGLLWDIGHLKEKTGDRLDIRAGFSGRYLDGSLELKAENGSELKKEYDKIIPMVDIEAEVEVLPVHQDLTAEVILEYQVYTFDGEWMHDFIDSIRINYKRGFIEGGYRIIKFKLSKDDITTKTTAAGFFGSIGVMF